MSRPSHSQMEVLTEFLVRNPGIAKGILRTAHAKQETKRKWNEISSSLNALGGAQKNGKGWAKFWADKKFSLKKTCAQHAQLLRYPGGEEAETLPVLTPLEQRLVTVMGGPQIVAGDSNIQSTVNTFPSTSETQNNIHFEILIPTQEIDGHVVDPPASNIDIVKGSTPELQTEKTTVISPKMESERRPRRISQTHGRRTRSRATEEQRKEFAAIGRRRAEAEIATARAISKAVEEMTRFNSSMEDLSAAIREGAQTVASALNNIANALRRH